MNVQEGCSRRTGYTGATASFRNSRDLAGQKESKGNQLSRPSFAPSGQTNKAEQTRSQKSQSGRLRNRRYRRSDVAAGDVLKIVAIAAEDVPGDVRVDHRNWPVRIQEDAFRKV